MQPNYIFKKKTSGSLFHCMITLLTFVIFIQLNSSWGQNHSQDIWNFGQNAVLDFSTGTGVVVQPNLSALISGEACATVCDKITGQVLFYTNAIDIWDKNNILKTPVTKLNGQVNTLNPAHSAAQGCLIVPMQGNPNRYYIFTVSDAHNELTYHNNGLCYTIVDVTATSINIISVNNPVPIGGASPWTTPQLTAIPNCDGSYWVITHGLNNVAGVTNTDLRAYLLTSSGIAAPIISTGFPTTWLGTVHNSIDVGDPVSNRWMAKASPDGNKVAFAVHNYSSSIDAYTSDETFVYNFNRYTGTFSNQQSYTGGSHGISFSPNSQLLYTVTYNPSPTGHHDLWQHQLGGTPNSQFEDIGQSTQPTMGPDKRIYLIAQNSSNLDVINNPDNIYSFPASTSLGYSANALTFFSSYANYALPNHINAIPPVVAKIPVQNVCVNGSKIKMGIHNPGSMLPGTYNTPYFSPSPGNLFSSSTGFAYVNNGAWFSPIDAGVGPHTIHFTTGCGDTAFCVINVMDTPMVNFPPILDINMCTYNGTPVNIPITSNGNTCTLSGPGTNPANNTFDPVLAGGVGTYTLTYTCTNANGCSATVDQTITVIDADQWHQTTMGSATGDKYTDVTTDLAGNVYVVGSFKTQTTLDGGYNPNITINSNAGSNEATFLAKYDRCANLIWVARVTDSETSIGQSIVLDESHHVLYITGDYSNTAKFNSAGGCPSGYSQIISGPLYGAYVAQYDMITGCLYFVQDASIPPNIVTDPQSITINQNSGVIYVVGKYGLTIGSQGNAYIKKYTPTISGIGGSLGAGWLITSTGTASVANDIDFDEINSRLWVIGSFTSNITFNAGGSKSTNLGNTDAFLVGYRDLGASVSLYKMFKGNVPTTATMTGEGVAVNDLNGNPCITGSYNGVITGPTNPPFELVAPMNTAPLVNTGSTINAYMICMNFLSPSSAWSRIVEANPGIANGYAVDIKNSRAYFTGNFNSTINIGAMSYPYVGTSGPRIYAASYNIASPATGPFANVTTSPSSGNHTPQAITTDNANHMYIVGLYSGTMSYLNGVPASGNLLSTGVGTNGFILRGDLSNGDFKMQTIEDETTENETRFSFTITAVPNPTTGIVEVWTDGLPDDANAEIEVSSLMGVVVYKGRLTSKKYAIDLSDLSAGTYILRVMYNGYPATARIIKI